MTSLQEQLKKPHFGLHLTFDGYRGDFATLNNRKKVINFLNSLVKKLRMIKLIGPCVVRVKDNHKKDPGGYTGFVVIQESHISVHTFPSRGFVSIDVYSCNDFDYKSGASFIKKFFKVKSAETCVIVRGRRYPPKDIR